jgi:hypothetical protein
MDLSLINSLGGEVYPYQRNIMKIHKKLFPEDIIDFSSYLIDYTEKSFWIEYKSYFINKKHLVFLPNREKTFLWIIDKEGFKIALESIKNPYSERGCISHSNLTKGQKAIQGGEVFFDENKIAYVNSNSSKYGNVTELEFNNAILFISSLNIFNKVININKKL